MAPLLFRLYAEEALFRAIVGGLGGDCGEIEQRSFPDGESYVRIVTDCNARDVVIVCGLDRPNDKILPLLFAAQTIRDLGARRLSLITPYLPYMRQDQQFCPGESVSARYFAAMLGRYFDRLITVDPHLHRIHDLTTVCPIECTVLHAAPAVADWIKTTVPEPILIGPDEESEQWVVRVAELASAPYSIGRKVRRGDRDVAVTLSAPVGTRTPVLVDDIISTGRTMAVTVAGLAAAGHRPPVCVGVHALFEEEARRALLDAGAAMVVTCNTVHHPSNAIDIAPVITAALAT